MAKSSDSCDGLCPVGHRISFTTPDGDGGLRLDQLLGRHVPDLSRRRARALIEQGSVYVDKKRTKVASRAIRAGQKILITSLELITKETELPPLDGTIRYEDDSLLIFDKPSGLLSAPSQETDQNDLHSLAQKRAGRPLWLVHRLDRPTSGLIVFAKTKAAAKTLSEALKDHSMGRDYLAIVVGVPPSPSARATSSIEGQPAATEFLLRESRGEVSLVEARLQTGRTHQVRIHATELGCPIVGDRRYGLQLARQRAVPPSPRLLLHATRLRLTHPERGAPLELESPMPDDMRAYWERVGAQHLAAPPVPRGT